MERFSEFVGHSTVGGIPPFSDDLKLRFQAVFNIDADNQPMETFVDHNGEVANVLTWVLDDNASIELTYDRKSLKLISVIYYGDSIVGMKLFNSRALMRALGVDEQTLYLSTRQTNPIEVRDAIRYTFI